MCVDEYIYSQPITVGGAPGRYIIECPFSGDEYEWSVLSLASESGGQAFLSDSLERSFDIPLDGSVSYGALGAAPWTKLDGLLYRIPPAGSIVPPPLWFRLPTGKNLFLYVNGGAGSIFVTVAFRFLPVRFIPGRTLTVPDTMEEQHNLLRSEKIVKRLELELQEGDLEEKGYGRLK